MTREIWKPIKSYEDSYEVSNLGNVRSKDRTVYSSHPQCLVDRETNKKGKSKGKVIVNGYYKVCFCQQGRRMNYSVHRLVALAFIPNPENKPTVNHINGNKLDNNLSNLEWATQQEQVDHSIITGLRKDAVYGDKLPQTKMTIEEVKTVKRLIVAGVRPFDIHKQVPSCGYSSVFAIRNNRIWKHVKI